MGCSSFLCKWKKKTFVRKKNLSYIHIWTFLFSDIFLNEGSIMYIFTYCNRADMISNSVLVNIA